MIKTIKASAQNKVFANRRHSRIRRFSFRGDLHGPAGP